MVIDFETHSSGESIEADIVIFGSGAAGIAMALQFIETDIRVLLIESGGKKITKKSQSLNIANNNSVVDYDLLSQRARFFGGTTNFWGGTCIEFSPIDYVKRPPREMYGWPIDHAEIDQYLDRAKEVCGVGASHFNFPSIVLNESKMLEWNAWQFSPFPFRFGDVYGSQLANSPNIHVYLNANLTGLEGSPHKSKCIGAEISSLNGKRSTIRASQFVLACGGIENARLLLNFGQDSTKNFPKLNVNTGKHFSDHPTALIGFITGQDSLALYEMHKLILESSGKGVKPIFGLQQEFLEKNKLLNAAITVWPIPMQNKAISRLRAALFLLRRRDFGFKLLLNLFLALPASIGLLPHVIHRMQGGSRDIPYRNDKFEIRLVTETVPNFKSEVSLVEKYDVLGLRQANISWVLSEADKQSFVDISKAFKVEVEKLWDVQFEFVEWIKNDLNDIQKHINTNGHHGHHMGTTRMSKKEDHGVVDSNCKVFGVDNLYIAGSSVFPTYSFANPTLTIVALAIRLADFLKFKNSKTK